MNEQNELNQTNLFESSPEGCSATPGNRAWPGGSLCDCCHCWHSPAVEHGPAIAPIVSAKEPHTYDELGSKEKR